MRRKIQITFEQGNRVPFSMRLFWSIFAMFLGFMICFLLFQYQREHEFAQEKLKSILNNYNYQLYLQTQYNNEIPLTVQQFIQHIPYPFRTQLAKRVCSPSRTAVAWEITPRSASMAVSPMPSERTCSPPR